ncbi:hypothetical protein PHYPSEUDO_004662, partial [Phytophthora pseudosyringae]
RWSRVCMGRNVRDACTLPLRIVQVQESLPNSWRVWTTRTARWTTCSALMGWKRWSRPSVTRRCAWALTACTWRSLPTRCCPSMCRLRVLLRGSTFPSRWSTCPSVSSTRRTH